MVCVDPTDCRMETVVEINNSRVLGVTWLIKDVVPCDPSVVFVMLSKFLPKPNNPILEIAMIP